MSTTTVKAGRNDLCPCGSNRKYKRCCGAEEDGADDAAGRFFTVAAVGAGVMLLGGAFVFAQAFFAGEEEVGKKVWSEEHGHYHTVGGKGSQEGGPGKVWSEEHGHFHDAGPGAVPEASDGGPARGALEGLREAQLDAARQKVAPADDHGE